MGQQNMKMIHDRRWSHPTAQKLPARECLLWHFLMANKDSTSFGVYSIMTGAIMDGVGYHLFKDEDHPKSPVYPAIDKLVDVGLIAYDKETHTVRVCDYHRYRPFGNGSAYVYLKTIEKEFLTIHNENYFCDYLVENQELISGLIEKAEEIYSEFPDSKKKNSKYPSPDQLQIVKLSKKTFAKKKPETSINSISSDGLLKAASRGR